MENRGDPFCILNLFNLYTCHLPDYWLGPILRKGIPYHLCSRVVLDITGFQKFTQTDNSGNFGANDCNDTVKAVALWCNIKDVLKQVASGRRRAGITKIANAGLPVAEVIKAARHQSCVTNALYQVKSEQAHERRHQAQAYRVSFLLCKFVSM